MTRDNFNAHVEKMFGNPQPTDKMHITGERRLIMSPEEFAKHVESVCLNVKLSGKPHTTGSIIALIESQPDVEP